MAYPGPVSATQVGSYFVKQYYHTIGKQPELAHQFYTDSSSMIRIDGDSTETASGLLQIHNLVSSLQFTGIEIKTISALESWNGGVLVVVSGCIRAEYFSRKRNYVETFLLAPQNKGFFVLNDVFNFIEEEVLQQQHTVPVLSENRADSQLPVSTHHQENSGYTHNHCDYETEAGEYVNSVHIEESNQIHNCNIEEQKEQLYQQPEEDYTELENNPSEEASQFNENHVETVEEPQYSTEEPVAKPQIFTYASILQAYKGSSATTVPSRPNYAKKAAQQPQTAQQPTITEQPSHELPHENLSQEEEVDLLKSVYVRNLPSNVAASELEQEFKTFGKIIPEGVVIKNRQEIGVCFAFVEFEDLQAVHNAIKASPLQLAGRQIYVEGRRANSRSGRGRGRGSYQPDTYRGQYGRSSSGRGDYRDNRYQSSSGRGDYQDNRYRGNGFRS